MAWKPGANAALGVPSAIPTTPDATAQTLVGTRATFIEDTQGPCVLMYLPGVASLVAGDLCVYDLTPGAQSVTRLIKDTFANSGRHVAVALAAVLAGQYGWFQVGGVAIANAVAATAAGVVMATATTGKIGNTADAGDQILGARILTAVDTPAVGKVYMQVQDAHLQSQIT